MSALVVEERIATSAVTGSDGDLVVVPRARRRGRWMPLDADRVVATLSALRRDAIVMTRTAAADPGAVSLGALARIMGVDVVRLPDAEAEAAWAVAVAAHPDFGGRDRRRLEVLVGAAASGHARPSLRPGVLARWASRSWRPCARCAGGGLLGCPCGRCGVLVRGAPA